MTFVCGEIRHCVDVLGLKCFSTASHHTLVALGLGLPDGIYTYPLNTNMTP